MNTERWWCVAVTIMFIVLCVTILYYNNMKDSAIVKMVEAGANPVDAKIAVTGFTNIECVILSRTLTKCSGGKERR